MVSLAVQDVFGVNTHGFQDRKECPEKVRILVLEEFELVNELDVSLLYDISSD